MPGLAVPPCLLGLCLSVPSLRHAARQPSSRGLTASLVLLPEQAGRCLPDPLEEVDVTAVPPCKHFQQGLPSPDIKEKFLVQFLLCLEWS